ncbi:hypothetical protein CLV35_2354 [Motilibacter peucedani]|uniref:LppP/LprE lipoprotein n=1 Tax=Motilibacter peucedani TaxID=598650 RepID=A0A420XNT0_9ACTN|nr:hypothetical protein [Motilibacter peucedani]RKS73860.1 hypothetical protein CLV35_2354 [Motilibacter peucedani]
MRKSVLSTVLAAVLVLAMAGPASASPHAPTLHLKGKTSAIYGFDGSVEGTGPVLPAANVVAEVKNCPQGDWMLDATLVQDGVSYSWATTALGAGYGECGVDEAPFTVAMGFYGTALHSGRATAHFAIYHYVCSEGICSPEATTTMEDTRVVRIP